jgi:Na+-driven multidrug efflux pump
VIANVVNVILELVFVYDLHWGLAGSAWGTVIAQAGMGAAFVLALLAAPAGEHGRRPRLALMRPLLRMGSALIVRTASLYGSFLVASAVLARVNAWSLGAHQIGMQLFGWRWCWTRSRSPGRCSSADGWGPATSAARGPRPSA